MRYLNVKGQIAWKASPGMLSILADLEREAEAIWRIGPDGSGEGSKISSEMRALNSENSRPCFCRPAPKSLDDLSRVE